MSNTERITNEWYDRNRQLIHTSPISPSDLADVEYMHARLLMGLDPVPIPRCDGKAPLRSYVFGGMMLMVLTAASWILIIHPIIAFVRNR